MRTSLMFALLSILVSCAANENIKSESREGWGVLQALHIQPEVYHLGDVLEGSEAVATFFIRNNSPQAIELVDIQASCGCTAAEPDSYLILPGTFTRLKVTVDTTAKASDIKKSIHIKDSLGNEAAATLTFNVVENPHGRGKGVVKGIFDGKCASCHYTPLLGKREGKTIYQLGCAMCHGKDGEGAYAPGLLGFSQLSELKMTISKGAGKPQMPGFAKEHGGPLTPAQIDALAEWLMHLSNEIK